MSGLCIAVITGEQTGVQPGHRGVVQRKADKIASAASRAITYEAVAREFYAVKAESWSEGHATKWMRMNEL